MRWCNHVIIQWRKSIFDFDTSEFRIQYDIRNQHWESTSRINIENSELSFRFNISKLNLSIRYSDSSTATNDNANIFVKKTIQNSEIQFSRLEILYFSTVFFSLDDQSFDIHYICFLLSIVINDVSIYLRWNHQS